MQTTCFSASTVSQPGVELAISAFLKTCISEITLRVMNQLQVAVTVTGVFNYSR